MNFWGNHRFYINLVFALSLLVVIIVFFARRRKPKQKEDEDRQLFRSIQKGDADGVEGLPLGYSGFDAMGATDEVIDKFVKGTSESESDGDPSHE